MVSEASFHSGKRLFFYPSKRQWTHGFSSDWRSWVQSPVVRKSYLPQAWREICQSVLPRSESGGCRLALAFMSRDQEHCISWKWNIFYKLKRWQDSKSRLNKWDWVLAIFHGVEKLKSTKYRNITLRNQEQRVIDILGSHLQARSLYVYVLTLSVSGLI